MTLEAFLPLAEFLSQAYPAEIVVQSLEQGVLGAYGPTSRKPGDPPSAFLQALALEDRGECDWCEIYALRPEDGIPIHMAAWLFQEEGRLVGALSITVEVGDALYLGKALLALAGVGPVHFAPVALTDPLPTSPKPGDCEYAPVTQAMLALALEGTAVSRLTAGEVQKIVEWLTAQGALVQPGAVERTAAALRVSPSSIYRGMTKPQKLRKDRKRRMGSCP